MLIIINVSTVCITLIAAQFKWSIMTKIVLDSVCDDRSYDTKRKRSLFCLSLGWFHNKFSAQKGAIFHAPKIRFQGEATIIVTDEQ